MKTIKPKPKNQEAKKPFLFSSEGIPSTPQNTDPHPCARPGWSRSLSEWALVLNSIIQDFLFLFLTAFPVFCGRMRGNFLKGTVRSRCVIALAIGKKSSVVGTEGCTDSNVLYSTSGFDWGYGEVGEAHVGLLWQQEKSDQMSK